ncbi:membrane-bound PQQ-dependent dehydrogenase, glucose/quinate/shikimate family [Sphingobium aromaticiconvertens]|uniref:membrane-bound PQQ-dependent dehydrogenase, glucose/quinate/shikimate family n=1 Tax=Sphingobium aromaticiconvertens TaxID=365341 RepID=UPI003018C2EB
MHAGLLAAVALALAWPATTLLRAGGSLWYALSVLAMLGVAALTWRRDRCAAPFYGLFLVLTLLWSVWEVGIEPWALLPRLGLFLFLGLPFLGVLRPRVAAVVLVIISGAVLAIILAGRDPPVRSAANAIAARGSAGKVQPGAGDWRYYGNDAGGTRFSPLAQIDPANVGALRLAWTFRTGKPAIPGPVTFQTTPLAVDGRLYLCTGDNDVIALDGESGRQIWRFRAHADGRGVAIASCRGVAFHRRARAGAPCADRILTATMDARLIALDAATGQPCRDFGRNGAVDLRDGMAPVDKGYYFVTSPPQITGDRAVVGGWITDGQKIGEPSGVIRAFDVTTGALAWAFDAGRPDRHGLPPAGEHYTLGTPNSWAPMSADDALGLLFVPTGNATPDYFGGQRRPFDDRYSSAVVALDTATGAVRWVFQTTHHDLWDYDVPAQPTLTTIRGVPALVQPTKRGEIFVLDRRTGRPISTVVERRVPASAVPGERAAATQPFSPGMPSFAGPPLREADMWGLTPIDQAWCRTLFRRARYEGPMTPPGLDRPSLVYPGYGGGINWGGVSIDVARGIMIVNSNRVGNTVQLLTRAEARRRGIRALSVNSHGGASGAVAQEGVPYAADLKPLISPLGVPCQRPPWGMIGAVDLATGALMWSRPFGTGEDSGPFGIASRLPFAMGVPNSGGAVTTGAGISFIGATHDRYIRAIATATGRELWRGRLPAGGQATPMTFWSAASHRQFVVIAAGGHPGLGTLTGDYVIAYALPKASR